MWAQIVGSNAFLQGDFVEIGVNQCGAYGSNVASPATYHPTMGGDQLGFVADDDMDGWTGGTYPPYCGDYFLPGSPVEGWGIQIGGTTWYNTDQSCTSFSVPGNIVSYDVSGDVTTVVWEGNVTSESVSVQQTTVLIQDKRYFVTKLLVCNNSLTTKNNIYYKRNVDPDNDQPWSGSFVTENSIVYNPPADAASLVTSEGLTYGCFLGIGSLALNSRVSYGNFATTTGTAADVYNGTGGYSISGSSTADIANSIAFYIESLAPGECACFAFAYILDPDELDEALTATTLTDILVDADIVNDGETYVVCDPGVTIPMEITGSDDYLYTWTPAAIFDVDTGINVNATVSETTLVTVTGTGGDCGDIYVEFTLHVAEPPVIAIDDVSICEGESALLDLLAEAANSPCGPLEFENTTATIIPEGPIAESSISVFGLPYPTFTTDILAEVCININHLSTSHLDISLQCPDGTVIDLSSDNGAFGDNFSNTCFVVSGAPSITTGTAPFSGDFTPEQPFSTLTGCATNGVWTLVVDDDTPGTSGTILNWSISFVCENAFAIFEWSPSAGLSSTTIEDPIASPVVSTDYTVTLTDWAGCSYSESVSVFVTSAASAGFTYSAASFCLNDMDPSPIFATGAFAGTFSATPPGLIINPATGVIDVSASIVGTYTVINTIAAVDACPEFIGTTTVSIYPVFTNTQTAEICGDDMFILPDGTEVFASGSYTSIITSSLGCDSTIITDLTVHPVYNQLVAAFICDNENYILPDGVIVTAAGTYTVILPTIHGCDSTIITTLTVYPTYDIVFPVSICDDEVVVLPDGTIISDPPAGTYSHTFTSASGCDSIVSIVLTVLPVYDLTQMVIICEGDAFILPDGTLTTLAGEYESDLITGAGCDSIITTTIVVNPVFATSVEAEICSGEFYTLPGGTITSSAGTYNYTFTATNGCDSVVTTTLTVHPVYSVSVLNTICAGDNFTMPDGNVLIAPAVGIYSSTLTTINGCDSIVLVSLSHWPVYDIVIPEEICFGEFFTLPDGSSTGIEGSYFFNYNSIHGCDSTVTINLVVHPLPTPLITIPVYGICIDASPLALTAEPVGGIWEGIGVSGTMFNPAVAGVGGPYSVLYTYTDMYGCIDSAFTTLSVYDLPVVEILLPDYVCFENIGEPLIGIPAGGFFSGSGVSGDMFIAALTAVGGPFEVFYNYTDANGCFNSVSDNIWVFENTVYAGTDTTLFIGDSVFLQINTDEEINWLPDYNISCNDCSDIYFFPTYTTEYQLIETDANGCEASDYITIYVRTEPDINIFTPNAFTPNGDGMNDYFFIYGQDIVTIHVLQVFDRWGQIMYQGEKINGDAIQNGWDGKVLGSNASTGVYAFTADVELKGGYRTIVSGNVTLLR